MIGEELKRGALFVVVPPSGEKIGSAPRQNRLYKIPNLENVVCVGNERGMENKGQTIADQREMKGNREIGTGNREI